MKVEISRADFGVQSAYVVNVVDDSCTPEKLCFTSYSWDLSELFDGSCTSVRDLVEIFLSGAVDTGGR